jgi:hypothetical protein
VGTSITNLRREHAGDAALQSLLGIVSAKLELCSRLPILEYEAASEGNDACAAAFRGLAEAERRSVDDLLAHLQSHLAAAAAPDLPRRAAC